MTDSQPAPGTGWTVVSTVPRTLPDAGGVLTAGQEVTFLTASGQQGTVFLPSRGLTPDIARQKIQAAVLLADQIMALKG